MSLGEFDIIGRYFDGRRTSGDVELGIGDDAAILRSWRDRKLVVAMDTIVEGVHFPANTAASDIGYRALAVNLSDIAAMGAQPAWMTLSLSLPHADESWLEGFSAGLFELAERFGVTLVGGDTVRGPLVVTIQIGGWVEPDRWLARSTARPGDVLFVSGVPGEAAAGLALIQKPSRDKPAAEVLRRRFLRPEPRIELGRALRRTASAAMDVSDGLLVDLEKLCKASGCGASVDADRLPRSAAMREMFDERECLEFALSGGDDYELLFTVSPDRADELERAALPVAVTRIGEMVEGRSVTCTSGGVPMALGRRGYDHFGTGAA
jgi:thiamine-monophosphate kinase